MEHASHSLVIQGCQGIACVSPDLRHRLQWWQSLGARLAATENQVRAVPHTALGRRQSYVDRHQRGTSYSQFLIRNRGKPLSLENHRHKLKDTAPEKSEKYPHSLIKSMSEDLPLC